MDPSTFDAELAEAIASSPHNLVSRGDRARVRERHLPEARRLAECVGPVSGRWLDLGTGGGLPGLVLAHRWPDAEWVLMDATAKKVEEVRRFAQRLEVDCEIVSGRAEEMARDPRWRGSFDGVIARAVASLPTLLELARGFLPDGSVLIAVKGSGWEQEVGDAEGALRRTGMSVETVVELGLGDSRAIRVRAVGPVPDDVPRRTGVPARRPW